MNPCSIPALPVCAILTLNNQTAAAWNPVAWTLGLDNHGSDPDTDSGQLLTLGHWARLLQHSKT